MRLSGSTRSRVIDFLTSLPAEWPLPTLVMESENEMGLDWDEGVEGVVSLTIDDSDRIGFAALLGRESRYGRAECTDGLPATIRDLLARLYSSEQPR